MPGHEFVDLTVGPAAGDAFEVRVSQACGSMPLSLAVVRSVARVAERVERAGEEVEREKDRSQIKTEPRLGW